MKRCLVAIATVLGAILTAVTPAYGHSQEQQMSALADNEKYYQPVDKPAPPFSLRNWKGETVTLADLSGHVVVLCFIYASCTDVCPLHAAALAEVQQMVNETPMRDVVRFVGVTTDPVRDGSDVLRDYGAAQGLDPANWMFLTSAPDQPVDATRRLAESYGHGFVPGEHGYQVHGVVTHVIDGSGRWRANVHGLEFDPTNVVVLVNLLVNEDATHHDHPQETMWDWLRGLF